MSAKIKKFVKGGCKRRHAGNHTYQVRKLWWKRSWFIASLLGGYDTRTWGLKNGTPPRKD